MCSFVMCSLCSFKIFLWSKCPSKLTPHLLLCWLPAASPRPLKKTEIWNGAGPNAIFIKEKSDMMIGDGQKEQEDCLELGSFIGDYDVSVVEVYVAMITVMMVDGVVVAIVMVTVVDAKCCCFGDFIPHRPPP